MRHYFPDKDPDPAQWLALPEGDRFEVVSYAHRKERFNRGAARPHALLHVIVETQLALGEPASVPAALARLRTEGLSRHDSVHAIASVLAVHIHAVLETEASSSAPLPKAYDEAVSRLTRAAWLESLRGDG